MALNAGSVTGGVVGREKFSYELFGETMDCARAMLLGSQVHAVLVSQSVYDSVQDLYSFFGPLQVSEGGEMVAWGLQTGAIAPARRNTETDPRTMEDIPSRPDKAGPGAEAASRPPP
jgi:class 3 adenylate cyclase